MPFSRRFLLVLATELLVLPFGLRPTPALAHDISREAAGFVTELGDQAIAAISNSSMDNASRAQHFRQLFLKGFDVPAIGRFVLGRYWRTATDVQKTEFMKVFEDMVVLTYSSRFSEYAGEAVKPGETFKILSTRPEGVNHAIVTTQVVRPTGSPIRVEWRVLKPEGQLRIVDVIIEGVSMSVTQQQEFASVIQRNGGQVDSLITALKERTGRAS